MFNSNRFCFMLHFGERELAGVLSPVNERERETETETERERQRERERERQRGNMK